MEIQSNIPIHVDDEGNRVLQAFRTFLNVYEDFEGVNIYAQEILELQNPERNTLNVDFPHIMSHSAVLASAIELQFYRLYPFLCEAIRQLVIESCNDETLHTRLRRKEFYLGITNLKTKHHIRQLTADKIGKLLRISGQVVRTHPVHPELCLGNFACDECGMTTTNVPQQFKYTQPAKCENQQCQNRTRFLLDVYNSLFVDFQRLRIQESQEELPLGCVPRNVEIIVRGECVETAQPGDHCDFIGTLIAVPDVAMLSTPGVSAQTKSRTRGKDQSENEGLSGLKSLGVRELTYRDAFLVSSICSSNQTFGGIDFTHEEIAPSKLWNSLTPVDQSKIKLMSEDPQLVENICQGLFPNIYGNKEVKLGILLMLIGGVAKKTQGTTLRGDINICLIGDPSCGKSQFLKTVEKFSPRVIYTSGKASSAAGLTAAVVKDEESFDFVIEAGALMLADNGVCCIDEFDKMDPKDQVAIHEAMEQQTISITKAGVKATLNARCSILAAANPINGRYDTQRFLKQNVQLTAPILSRFDLIFVMIDENNQGADYAIAKKILDSHRQTLKENNSPSAYSIEDIRKYVMFTRCFKPTISKEAINEFKTCYLKLRLDEDGLGANRSKSKTTVRQLESLIRLSEAYARLKCELLITVEHVKKAYHLLDKSIMKMDMADVPLDEDDDFDHPVNTVLGDITNKTNTDGNVVDNAAEDSGPVLMDITSGNLQISGDKIPPRHPGVDSDKLKISYQNYKRITNLLVLHMREDEERNGENEDFEGIKQSQLIDWYLDTIESDLETEEDYNTHKTIIERVVHLLIRKDRVLIRLTEDEDPSIVVNPNFEIDD